MQVWEGVISDSVNVVSRQTSRNILEMNFKLKKTELINIVNDNFGRESYCP